MYKKLSKLEKFLNKHNLVKEAADIKKIMERLEDPGVLDLLKRNDSTSFYLAEKEVEEYLLKNNPILMLKLITPNEDLRIPFNPQVIHIKNNAPLKKTYPIDFISYFIGRNPAQAIITHARKKRENKGEPLAEDSIISQLMAANNQQIISTDSSTDDLQIIVTISSPNTITLRQPSNATMETIVGPGRRATLPISELFKNREELALGNTGVSIRAMRGSEIGISPGIIRQAKRKKL